MSKTLALTGNKVTVPINQLETEQCETFKQLDTVFVVVALGYWGKGYTLAEAAANCRKEGCKATEICVAYAYTREENVNKPLFDEITVDGMGGINYPQTAASIYLFGPSKGQKVKLGAIINKNRQ